jgi:AbrB family looped-hinge helix DNA binding protein
MSLVSVKNKFQVVIPQEVRERIGIQVGDVLEAKVERGKITFTPRTALDPDIAASIEEIKNGRSYGPFDSAADAIAAMKRELRKRAEKGRLRGR